MNFEQYRVWFLANCVSEELKQEMIDKRAFGLDTEAEVEAIIQAEYRKHCKLEEYYNTGKWE